MRLIPVLALALALVGAACSDDSTTAPTDTQGSSLKATVDGKAFTGTVVSAKKLSGQTVVNAVSADGAAIALTLGTISTTGDYELGVMPGGSYTTGSTVYMTVFAGSPGTLKITTFDATHVAGSFSFTAATQPGSGTTKTVSVTGGTFNAKFE